MDLTRFEQARPEDDVLFTGSAGVRPRGFWNTFGTAMDFAAGDVGRRWKSLFDDSGDQITAPEFKELAGERPVQWFPGMTRRQAEERVIGHDFELHMAQFQRRPVAEFLGMMPPFFGDPVTLATLPVGGAAFGRAVMAPTAKAFFRESLVGGGQVGLASAPLEAGVQITAYGEIRPDMLLAATLAPVALAPLGTGVVKGIRHLISPQDMALAGRMSADDPSQFYRAFQALQEPDVPMPPAPLATPGRGLPPPPEFRLRQMFGDYEGGAPAWVRDIAGGVETAIAKAQRLGLDMDHPAIRDLIVTRARVKAGRAAPDDNAMEQLLDFQATIRGQASPEQLDRLRAAGMLDDAERATRAEAVPGFQRTAMDVQAVRTVEARLKALEGKADPAFQQLREAYATDPALRTAEQRIAIRDFERHGAGSVRAAHMNRLEGQYERLATRVAELEEALARTKGRKPKARLAELAEAKAERARLWEALEAQRAVFRDLDTDIPPAEIMAALDAAMLDRPNPVYTAPKRPQGQTEVADSAAQAREFAARTMDDAETAELEAFAAKVGVDLEGARSLMNAIDEATARC